MPPLPHSPPSYEYKLILELLVSACELNPDPQSEAYLTIIETFNHLRQRIGLPKLLQLMYELGNNAPKK